MRKKKQKRKEEHLRKIITDLVEVLVEYRLDDKCNCELGTCKHCKSWKVLVEVFKT